MNQVNEVSEAILAYVVREIMDGEADGLDANSPLLEWGILNSLEIVRLRVFVKEAFGVNVTDEMAQGDSFATIDAIAQLVVALRSAESAVIGRAGRTALGEIHG